MKPFFFLICLILMPGVVGIVIDDANMLSEGLLAEVAAFNQASTVELSIITVPVTYNIAEQASENFDVYHLQLLLFYVAESDEAIILMPLEEGLPEALILELLDTYRGRTGKHLETIIRRLMQDTQYWEQSEKKPFCSLIKDGICDATCQEKDLDCFCGDGTCQAFESEVTCIVDCREIRQDYWCGFLPDKVCNEQCILVDIDCDIVPSNVEMQQQRFLQQYIAFAVILLALLILIYIILRRKA